MLLYSVLINLAFWFFVAILDRHKIYNTSIYAIWEWKDKDEYYERCTVYLKETTYFNRPFYSFKKEVANNYWKEKAFQLRDPRFNLYLGTQEQVLQYLTEDPYAQQRTFLALDFKHLNTNSSNDQYLAIHISHKIDTHKKEGSKSIYAYIYLDEKNPSFQRIETTKFEGKDRDGQEKSWNFMNSQVFRDFASKTISLKAFVEAFNWECWQELDINSTFEKTYPDLVKIMTDARETTEVEEVENKEKTTTN